jgi:hypothetical protein
VHDTEAERVSTLVPQYMREHHRSKRHEGLAELVVGTKVGKPAGMNTCIQLAPRK